MRASLTWMVVAALWGGIGCGADKASGASARSGANDAGTRGNGEANAIPAAEKSSHALLVGDTLSLIAESAVNAEARGRPQKGLSGCAQVRPQADLSVIVTMTGCTGPSKIFQFSGEVTFKLDRDKEAFAVWTSASGLAYTADEAALEAAVSAATSSLEVSGTASNLSASGTLRIDMGAPAYAKVQPGSSVSVWGAASFGATEATATSLAIAESTKLSWNLAAEPRCACPTGGSVKVANPMFEHAMIISFATGCGAVQATFEGFDERCAEQLANVSSEAATACAGTSTKQRRTCSTDSDCLRGQSCSAGACVVGAASDAGAGMGAGTTTGELASCSQECVDIATLESVLSSKCAAADGSRFAELVDGGIP